ncbi:MAG: exonuclease domain-containing protein [Alphaproteobacteria bacterium]|nr:exonuclease domain-containing protein [Alphaproteobacteria bacterium]
MTFVFYDTETSGLNKAFDQILQFAAIRTDSDFNEIARVDLRCRLQPHIIAAPQALKTTRISVERLTDPNLPSHFDMMSSVKDTLTSWSPAVFIGYNSIEFDEPMLRQALYQTLHQPYLTTTNGNTRSDALIAVQAASVFAPDALVFPVNGRKKVFKLDKLAPANGFDHAHAHDALADVEATVHICRLIAEKAPQVWENTLRFGKKEDVADFISREAVFSLTTVYGTASSHLVTYIGGNPHDKSDLFAFDLRIDPEKLFALPKNSLKKRLHALPRPIQRFRANGCPILETADNAPKSAAVLHIGMEELERRAGWLKANPDFCAELISLSINASVAQTPSPYVEERIYGPFYSKSDLKLMGVFHRAPWARRVGISEKFQDERLKILGQRAVYFENPGLLQPDIKNKLDAFVARKIGGGNANAPWLDIPKAIEEIDKLETEDKEPSALLADYKNYLMEKLGSANASLSEDNPKRNPRLNSRGNTSSCSTIR